MPCAALLCLLLRFLFSKVRFALPCPAFALLPVALFAFDAVYSAALCFVLLDFALLSIMLRSFALLSLVFLRCAVAWLCVVLLYAALFCSELLLNCFFIKNYCVAFLSICFVVLR